MDPDLFFVIHECARYAEEHALINGYPLQGVWGGINMSRNYSNNETEMGK
jgi:WhiB family redox-sensing transcriptional regulator